MSMVSERTWLGLLLVASLALRLVRLDQPIVENYVGRQVPTAMVARNLDQGSGFLRPQLDTGPFPNLFLVEPPVFAALAVGLHRASGLAIEPSGRAVSALGTTLAAWGIFGLTRRRQGAAVALLAVAAFSLFPVTIRYGRAFQPDMMALGLILAGMSLMDSGGRGHRNPGGTLLAVGLGMKVIFAYALVPLVLRDRRKPHRLSGTWVLLLVPAVLWYGHAATLLETGSRASADNAAIWLRALLPTAWLNPGTIRALAWLLMVRVFTPMGLGLGVFGLIQGTVARFWVVWAVAAGAWLAWLAGKAHHEYYWLALAPPLAVGLASGLVALAGRGRPRKALTVALGLGFAGMALGMSASTWRTPREWAALERAAEVIQDRVPADAWLVAPEALIHASDRRGCRLESGPEAVRRAAGEWGLERGDLPETPEDLVRVYRELGARYFADVGDPAGGRLRGALHRAIRRRYHPVLADEPGFLLIQLTERTHGPRSD